MEYLDQWAELSPQLRTVALRAYTQNPSAVVCPSHEYVYRAFRYFSPSDTRVVILGQDPYHSVIHTDNTGHYYPNEIPPVRKANGLAFGYHDDWPYDPDSSLQNIMTEVMSSEGPIKASSLRGQFDTSLESWAEQGILLLNTRLTVEAGKPLSHAGEFPGWEKPIRELIRQIDRMHREQMVWMLWGTEAQRLFDQAVGISGKRRDRDLAEPELHGLQIRTTHPCRFSHNRGDRAFTGSQCFEVANRYLRDYSKRGEINWSGGNPPTGGK